MSRTTPTGSGSTTTTPGLLGFSGGGGGSGVVPVGEEEGGGAGMEGSYGYSAVDSAILEAVFGANTGGGADANSNASLDPWTLFSDFSWDGGALGGSAGGATSS